MNAVDESYFMPSQSAWIRDESSLRIVEKARQVGFSYGDAYDSVRKSAILGGLDTWVTSRDEEQAKQYIRYCKRWSNVLNFAATDFGEKIFMTEEGKAIKVQVISYASGASVHALSSDPDAIVGKTGHVKCDEFALHKDQRNLYAIGKQVTQWGGTFSIISTHRGAHTVFNSMIRDIVEGGNPMGWSHHKVPIQLAVEQGIVERINRATKRNETREAWLARMRRECIDEEHWLQEYCCVPADESAAFITYDMIVACESEDAEKGFNYLQACQNPLYIGFDVARTSHLSVIDVEERVGDVFWERHRIEMRGKSFAEQRFELFRLIELKQTRRCCIDSTGLGMQIAEEAVSRFGTKVEAVRFSPQVKEDLAYPMRSAHENRSLRYPRNEALRLDLRGIKKEVTAAGNIRFVGESGDSHCDRFWAKALALHAGKRNMKPVSAVLI